MFPETRTASEVAYALQSKTDGNAVILKTKDERAINLAVALAGEENCRIGERCRVSEPPLSTPMIYVACLAAYNAGILHGWWIDANQDSDDILADIQEMLDDSPIDGAEEWAIHDFDNFGFIRISEHEKLETVAQWGQLIGENPNEEQAICHYIQYAKEKDVEPCSEHFQETYYGFFSSMKDFAQSDLIADLYDYENFRKTQPFWSQYIDWEYLAQELDTANDFYFSESTSGIYVFQ